MATCAPKRGYKPLRDAPGEYVYAPGMSSRPKVVFAGTPEFAVPCLRVLLSGEWDVSAVLTQPDRPAGRGRRLVQSAVKREALSHGLEVRQPTRLDDGESVADWGSRPDLLIVVAYGLVLPPRLLGWPRLGAINVHASLLPRWRGAAPIQYAILAGDTETGASIMKMDTGLDTGPVYGRRGLAIEATDTAARLHARLAELGAALLVDTLPGIIAGDLALAPNRVAPLRSAHIRLVLRKSAPLRSASRRSGARLPGPPMRRGGPKSCL